MKMTLNFFILLFLTLSLKLQAQERIYYVGHSLFGVNVPYQVSKIVDQKNIDNFYKHHILIGTPIQSCWEDTIYNIDNLWVPSLGVEIALGTNHLVALQENWDHIILTEAVPLLNYTRDTTVKYVSNFYNLARTHSPNVKKYIFATWEGDANDGITWRNYIEDLVPEWEDIADKAAAASGGDSVFVVPGNLAMMALYDSLQLGNIGSFTSIGAFFHADGIHPNEHGNYFMSCLIAACTYQANSIGVDSVKGGPYMSEFGMTDSVARQMIQKIAMETACRYERSGYKGDYCKIETDTTIIDTTATSISRFENNFLSLFPNPVKDFLKINLKENISFQFKIINLNGQVIKQAYFNSKVETIDLSLITKGMYVVQIQSKNKIYREKIIIQ